MVENASLGGFVLFLMRGNEWKQLFNKNQAEGESHSIGGKPNRAELMGGIQRKSLVLYS